MMRKTVIVGILLVISIAIAIYAWLGGFQPASITETVHAPRIVYGTHYQGKYGDLKLREIVVNTKKLLADQEQSWMVVVNLDSLSASKEINQLIGVMSLDARPEVPDSLTTDTIPAGRYLRIGLHGHPVVRPTPGQNNQEAKKYAEQQQLMLGKEVIEHYFGTDSMWVEYSVEPQSR